MSIVPKVGTAPLTNRLWHPQKLKVTMHMFSCYTKPYFPYSEEQTKGTNGDN